jgi:DeoR/GlpR family transcriptional regulator of sugar metabolism
VLENQHLLQKTYGGAIPIRLEAHKSTISERIYTNQSAKVAIAEKAFSLIDDYDTIFLDISTVNMLLAEKLAVSKKKVTVITNMLAIISALSNQDNNITIISTGGILSKYINGFTGSMTISSIANYKPNKAFIGSCGVDLLDKSITTFDVEDGNTKKAIIKNSKVSYLVMESDKFYFDGTFKFAMLSEIDGIITDTHPNKEITSLLTKTHTSLI